MPELSVEEIQRKFLRLAVSRDGADLRTLATAFISFFLEWDYRLALIRIRVGRGTAEPFFLHLFKGCLLFESLLKANKKKPIRAGQLGDALKNLSAQLNIKRININGAKLPAIIASLGTADDSIEKSLEIAGRIRNTVGHDLGWQVALDARAYDGLTSRIASSILHAIASLYR